MCGNAGNAKRSAVGSIRALQVSDLGVPAEAGWPEYLVDLEDLRPELWTILEYCIGRVGSWRAGKGWLARMSGGLKRV